MNYILDYLNNLSDSKNPNLVFSSFHDVQVQDPLSKLIKWLNTEKRTGIKIKSEEDLLIEDFLPTPNNRPIQLNLDGKKENNKTEISILKKNRRNPQFPTEQQKLILSELKKVPVYTVVNGNNEIILASPREESSDNSLKWFYKQYYNWFVWKNDDGPITVGLFFSNREDAESYLHEICLKDPRGAQNLGLSVKSTGLDTFYYLNRTSNPQVQLKMISDLEELDLLLRINIKKNLSFVNPKQKYGKNWFKGTPIYILRGDEISRNENNNEKKEKVKKLVFFSKKDVEKTLKISNHKEAILEIYNFENYLLDLEKSSCADIERIKFIPSYVSYQEIDQNIEKSTIEISQDKKIKRIFVEKIKSIQRFCKGVIWLVTSDTLPSEENSW